MDKQKQIFDEYGNYVFPTDIKQKGLNTVSSCAGKNNHSVEANKMVEDIKCFLVCKKWGEYLIECDESVDCVDCIANGIYNAGYRKIPENAVVLTREEYNRLLGQYKNLEINYNCVWEDFRRYEIENEVLKQNIVVLRKETAEKFAERLKARFDKSREYYSIDTGTAWSNGCVGGLINDTIDEIAKKITEGKE